MASLASINIKFQADLKEYSKQMQTVQRELEKTGRQLDKIGKKMSLAITAPLMAIGGFSLKEFIDTEGVENAFKRLDDPNLLKNLQAATKGTVSNLELMKNAVQAKNFEIPLEELGTLLEFAQRRAKDTGESVDYLVNSIVTGIGRKSPLILDNLGISATALKDGLKGVSMEASSIADVTKVVGKIAKEQLDLMGEDTLTWGEQWSQVMATIKNEMANIGAIIAPMLQPLFKVANDLLAKFSELSPETKKFIVVLGGIAAAIGPLLVLAGATLPALATGFGLLLSPIGLIAAGLTTIGVIIYKNWEPIKRSLRQIANYFIELYNESTLFRAGVESVILQFKTLFEVGKFIFETLKNIVSGFIDNFLNGFKSFGKIIKAVLTGDLKSIPDIVNEAMNDSGKVFGGMTAELSNDWKNMVEAMKTDTNTALDNIKNKRIELYADIVVDDEQVQKTVSKNLGTTKTPNIDKSAITDNKLTPDDFRWIAESKREIEKMSQDLETIFRETGVNLDNAIQDAGFESMFEGVKLGYDKMLSDTDDFIDQLEEKFNHISRLGEEFSQGILDIMAEGAENLAVGFGSFLGEMAAGNAGLDSLVSMMLGVIADMAIQLGKLAISMGIAVGAIKRALQSLNPAVAIAAGIALVALGTFVKSKMSSIANVPKFADGGIVGGTSFYGDKILARVNSGELILNKKQQERVYGAMNGGANVDVNVGGEFRLQGDNLVAVIERTVRKINRQT